MFLQSSLQYQIVQNKPNTHMCCFLIKITIIIEIIWHLQRIDFPDSPLAEFLLRKQFITLYLLVDRISNTLDDLAFYVQMRNFMMKFGIFIACQTNKTLLEGNRDLIISSDVQNIRRNEGNIGIIL